MSISPEEREQQRMTNAVDDGVSHALDRSLLGNMSLRDYFAAQALPALIRANLPEHDKTLSDLINGIATASYYYADAMLKAREEGQ